MTTSATPSQPNTWKARSTLAVSRVGPVEHGQVVAHDPEEMREEAGSCCLAADLRAAGQQVEERRAPVGQVPEEAGRIAESPAVAEDGERAERSPPIEEDEDHPDRRERDDGEDVAPEREAQQETGDTRDGPPVL